MWRDFGNKSPHVKPLGLIFWSLTFFRTLESPLPCDHGLHTVYTHTLSLSLSIHFYLKESNNTSNPHLYTLSFFLSKNLEVLLELVSSNQILRGKGKGKKKKKKKEGKGIGKMTIPLPSLRYTVQSVPANLLQFTNPTSTNESQEPKENVLWIGCSDSSVTETYVLNNVSRSEIFVHRNLGNRVSVGDTSSGSAIEWAVDVLKVC